MRGCELGHDPLTVAAKQQKATHDMTDVFEFFGPQVLNETVCISLKHRYIYFEVPKAGSTSILQALHALELADLPDSVELDYHPASITSPFVKPYQLSRDHFLALLHDPDFFKFSFVRNPYPRILSAYLDKILSPDPEIAAYHRDQLTLPLGRSVSFDEFLQGVSMQDAQAMNKHWRPQVYQSMSAFCQLDFVGKVESFETDFAYVAQRIDADLPAIGHIAPHATKARTRVSEFYDDAAIDLMQATYADDFGTFDYDARSKVTATEPQTVPSP